MRLKHFLIIMLGLAVYACQPQPNPFPDLELVDNLSKEQEEIIKSVFLTSVITKETFETCKSCLESKDIQKYQDCVGNTQSRGSQEECPVGFEIPIFYLNCDTVQSGPGSSGMPPPPPTCGQLTATGFGQGDELQSVSRSTTDRCQTFILKPKTTDTDQKVVISYCDASKEEKKFLDKFLEKEFSETYFNKTNANYRTFFSLGVNGSGIRRYVSFEYKEPSDLIGIRVHRIAE